MNSAQSLFQWNVTKELQSAAFPRGSSLEPQCKAYIQFSLGSKYRGSWGGSSDFFSLNLSLALHKNVTLQHNRGQDSFYADCSSCQSLYIGLYLGKDFHSVRPAAPITLWAEIGCDSPRHRSACPSCIDEIVCSSQLERDVIFLRSRMLFLEVCPLVGSRVIFYG